MSPQNYKTIFWKSYHLFECIYSSVVVQVKSILLIRKQVGVMTRLIFGFLSQGTRIWGKEIVWENHYVRNKFIWMLHKTSLNTQPDMKYLCFSFLKYFWLMITKFQEFFQDKEFLFSWTNHKFSLGKFKMTSSNFCHSGSNWNSVYIKYKSTIMSQMLVQVWVCIQNW